MKIRIVLLILAIVFGIAAVFGVMIYLNNVRTSAEKDNELVSVLMAAKTIPKDTSADLLLLEKFVEKRQVPRKYIAEGAIDDLGKYEGYIIVEQVSKGEQLTPLKLMKIEDVKLAFIVPDGLIAVSIPYDETRGVSNYVKSGDKVSLIATFEATEPGIILTKEMVMNLILKDSQDSTAAGQDGTGTVQDGTASQGQGTTGFGFFDLSDTAKKAGDIMGDKDYVVYPQTRILLWNVQVLSIGVNVVSTPQSKDEETAAAAKSTAKETFKTVTLAVTPEQAEKLIFAQELGKVWFALMPLKGINEQETPGRTYFNITD